MAVNDEVSIDAGNGGGVRQRSRASIERRILEAAESVFAEAGFNGATTADGKEYAELGEMAYLDRKREQYWQAVRADPLEAGHNPR